jgi:hypothetical protein
MIPAVGFVFKDLANINHHIPGEQFPTIRQHMCMTLAVRNQTLVSSFCLDIHLEHLLGPVMATYANVFVCEDVCLRAVSNYALVVASTFMLVLVEFDRVPHRAQIALAFGFQTLATTGCNSL